MIRYIFPILFAIFVGCSGSDQPTDPNGNNGDDPPPTGNLSYELTDAFPNLSFSKPVDLQHAGDNSGRLFVVEQQGTIRVFDNSSTAGSAALFLDIQDRVDDRGNEEGLLGLAFHPDFESNGYFYLNYTASNPARTVISRFEVSDQDPDLALESSETVILSFNQPYDNHNGGQLAFGPDGYLYIAVGDGGSGGDPQENAQNRSTLLGSILRIDVDGQENGNNYAIPPNNPYAGNSQGFREEIFAYGLRNPWRFSFDTESGRLWAADVGQSSYEEIDIIEAGNNYGWDIMEGEHCYEPSQNCDTTGLTMPVWEYPHSEGSSVTGGFVYNGPTLGSLTGQYVYADFVSGKIWALDYGGSDDVTNTELLDTDRNISSFGVDSENELYLCAFDGNIYKLEESSE